MGFYALHHLILFHFSLSVKAVTLIFISGRDLAISSTHEGKTGNINSKTENFNCLLRVNKYKLGKVERSVAYWINIPLSNSNIVSSIPSRGDYLFLFKRIIYFYFFLIFFTFVLERSFMFNYIYSRFIFSLLFYK